MWIWFYLIDKGMRIDFGDFIVWLRILIDDIVGRVDGVIFCWIGVIDCWVVVIVGVIIGDWVRIYVNVSMSCKYYSFIK